MANPVVGIDIIARLDQFKAELAKLPDIGGKEAKALVGQLSREIKSAENAAKKAADVSKQTAAGFEQMETSVSKAAKALGPLGGVLSRVSPEAGAAASAIAGLTSAVEGFEASGFTGALVGLLPIVAALGGAIYAATGIMDDYTAATKAAEHAHVSLAQAMAPLDEAIAAAKDEQRLLNDALDSGAAKKYLAIADLSAKADAKEAEATKALREEKEGLMAAFGKMANEGTTEAITTKNRIDQIDRELAAVHAKANEYARLAVANDTARKFLEGLTDAEKKGTDAKDRLAAATKLAAEQERDFEEASRASQASLAAYQSALDALVDLRDRANASQNDDYEKLDAEHTKALADITTREKEAVEQRLGDEAGVAEAATLASEARKAADVAYYADKDKLRAKDLEAAAKAADEAAKVEADLHAQAVDHALQVGGYLQEGISMVSAALDDTYQTSLDIANSLTQQLAAGEEYYTDAQEEELKKRIKAQQNAAKKAFEAAKAAKVAEAFASTALAAINAIAQSPPPSPFGLIGAGIATAAGLASVAAIESQNLTFHKGGLPDEVPATLLRKEAVLSPLGRETVGDENIRRANAGVSAPGERIIVVDRYRHQTFNRFVRDNLKMGSPITTLVNAGKMVGHRVNRRGSN
jgi:hypothetical protein